jgi:hypothetical protein
MCSSSIRLYAMSTRQRPPTLMMSLSGKPGQALGVNSCSTDDGHERAFKKNIRTWTLDFPTPMPSAVP